VGLSSSEKDRLTITAGPPPFRRLRAYAFDPSLSIQLETAILNQVILPVRWEEGLKPGPVGEYLEVVDYDPAGGCFYEPVDLDRPHLLARDGLDPSEGNPQFHQQMVYAVAMTTIQNFERALGRKALWAPHVIRDPKTDKVVKSEPVQRLRVYPHALREANSYYSPEKKALVFGYFPASRSDPGHNLPGGLVFSCLSHDIVAHETTHALLDGIHRRFIEPTNPDVLALHEGFADIVALFQHFSFPDVLRNQIARTRANLSDQNLLGELAQQFGEAIGQRGALRSALGRVNPKTGLWEPLDPDPEAYRTTAEPHARGAILVAAVFDAFLAIYKARIGDLLRIATGGSGVLPPGEMHPDLVKRLAGEAAKAAHQVLTICIRALDYVPPVDLTFGDYLRALITADLDMVHDDGPGYRIAFIEAFRRRGIYPDNVRTLSVESLRWQGPAAVLRDTEADLLILQKPQTDTLRKLLADWNLTSREEVCLRSERLRAELHEWFKAFKHEASRQRPDAVQRIETITGLALDDTTAPRTIERDDGEPKFEIHSVRPARRVGPDGLVKVDLVLEILQKRLGYFDPKKQKQADDQGQLSGRADFTFRGGCTIIVDMDSGLTRLVISKRVVHTHRLHRQCDFLQSPGGTSLRATYFADPCRAGGAELFALLHRDG
jgi:hypothetical protein